jgi:SMC interacting uncharacterized protein involved in chromosome segregation
MLNSNTLNQEKKENHSKVSAECIRHLNSQIAVLTEENNKYKKDIDMYKLMIQDINTQKTFKPFGDLNKLQKQIKKIENMNVLFKKEIENLRDNLEKEQKKNFELNKVIQGDIELKKDLNLGDIKSKLTFYADYITRLSKYNQELLQEISELQVENKKLKDQYKRALNLKPIITKLSN